jgi:hypothetical protein
MYEFDTVVDTNKLQQHQTCSIYFSDDERYIVSLEDAQIRVFQIDPVTGNCVFDSDYYTRC